MARRVAFIRVAHASRVLATASSPSRTFVSAKVHGKVRFCETQKPTRETRALPETAAVASFSGNADQRITRGKDFPDDRTAWCLALGEQAQHGVEPSGRHRKQ